MQRGNKRTVRGRSPGRSCNSSACSGSFADHRIATASQCYSAEKPSRPLSLLPSCCRRRAHHATVRIQPAAAAKGGSPSVLASSKNTVSNCFNVMVTYIAPVIAIVDVAFTSGPLVNVGTEANPPEALARCAAMRNAGCLMGVRLVSKGQRIIRPLLA